MTKKLNKIVLAYSGGLDTSVIIKWLKEEYEVEVIAFCADLGQGAELDTVREKALATGASKVYIEDLKEEFVKDFVFPMLRANAFYENNYLLGTAIARPLIAKPSPLLDTVTRSPSAIRPSRMSSAKAFCSSRWITRFNGRAP